jgi:hypothetical protein
MKRKVSHTLLKYENHVFLFEFEDIKFMNL